MIVDGNYEKEFIKKLEEITGIKFKFKDYCFETGQRRIHFKDNILNKEITLFIK